MSNPTQNTQSIAPKPAITSVPIHDLIARRWSPRALDENAEISDVQLRALLEAARWAASSSNAQPARYLVGKRGDESFEKILSSLSRGNKAWAFRASALFIGVMLTHSEKGAIAHAEYGLGLASQNLVLQAVAEGLVAHQMGGFDPEVIHREFGLPENAVARVAIAVGVQSEPESLVEEDRIAKELAPRERIPLSEFAYTQTWSTPAF